MTNLNTELARHESARHTLSVGLAISEREILSAQKLRYRVFADELGARLNPRTPGVDQDIFDPYCEHLVVRDERSGEVIGTYRILSPEQAKAVGSYYSETEFDLIRLQHLRPRMVEIGRSCVHPDYRAEMTDYLERALRDAPGKHTPHLLDQAYAWHQRYLKTGSMQG